MVMHGFRGGGCYLRGRGRDGGVHDPNAVSCDDIDIETFKVLDPVHAVCYAAICILHMFICSVISVYVLLFDLILSTCGLLLT